MSLKLVGADEVALEDLVVGGAYTRSDIDEAIGSNRVALSREGPIYFPELQCAFLFVTLVKSGRAEGLHYNDWFENDFFHWDSQNTQHIDTPRIKQITSGDLEPHLLVRVVQMVKGKTQPYVYAGRLQFATHDESTHNPVHIVWECLDYQDEPNAALKAVYHWSPYAAGAPPERESVAPSVSKRRARGQAFLQDAALKRKIELHAMEVAVRWYEGQGYIVTDTSAFESFDLECQLDGPGRTRVEVKGTSGSADTVFLTDNEVRAARSDGIPTDLFIVSDIEIAGGPSEGWAVQGGRGARIEGWIPEEDRLQPVQYRYSVPTSKLEPI